jgi:hypothetical protein
MMAGGFLMILAALLVNLRRINAAALASAVTGFPSLLFFIAWMGLMFFMGWFRKNRFQNDDAHSNWTAQIINAVGQTCLLLGILFAK